MIENFVEKRLADVRHGMRNELAVVGGKVELLAGQVGAAAVKSSEEHAEVKVELRSLHDEIAYLRERSAALDGLRASMRNQNIAVVTVLIAAAALVAGLLH